MKDNTTEQLDKWRKAAKGVRYRLHPTCKHGKQPDRYYVIRYTAEGEKRQEALGWASEGWTLEKVQEQLLRLKSGLKLGEGPTSLREKRFLAKEKNQEIAKQRKEQAKQLITLNEYYETNYKPWKSLARPIAFSKEASHWIHWLEPNLGSMPMQSIKLEHWFLLTNAMRQVDLAQRTIEYICGTLRRILKHAHQQRLILELPPSASQIGATSPKNNRRLRVLSQQELKDLLSEIQTRDISAWRLTIFAMFMGCRFSDAANLLWGQVDFQRKTVTFAKTKTVARVIPIGEELLSFLLGFGPQTSQEHVFLSKKEKPYTEAPSAFSNAVKALKLNVCRPKNEYFSFHNLRHMAATDLARALPLRDLMDYMGWKTASMALRYMHGNEEVQRAAIAGREKQLTEICQTIITE